MNENKRSVLYAGVLQFRFPGLGRFYLGDWGIGLLQFLACFIVIGLLWSWIDGYLMIAHQTNIKRDKVSLVYYELQTNKDNSIILSSEVNQLANDKSPIAAYILQLSFLGIGRLYLGHTFIGIFQLLCAFMLLGFSSIFFVSYFIKCGWEVLDAYAIFKGGQVNSDKRPLNYSVAINFIGTEMVSKDRFIAGMLQTVCPGLGRCYLGYWWVGILQFFTSWIIIGAIWSWVDGHHILLNPDVDRDGKGNLLTDQYRLKTEVCL